MSVFGQLYDLKEELGKGKRFFVNFSQKSIKFLKLSQVLGIIIIEHKDKKQFILSCFFNFKC